MVQGMSKYLQHIRSVCPCIKGLWAICQKLILMHGVNCDTETCYELCHFIYNHANNNYIHCEVRMHNSYIMFTHSFHKIGFTLYKVQGGSVFTPYIFSCHDHAIPTFHKNKPVCYIFWLKILAIETCYSVNMNRSYLLTSPS